MKAVSYNQRNGGHGGLVPRSPTGPCMGSILSFSLILLNLENRCWMRKGNNCFWVELSRGWDFLVAQKEKNLPSMQETWVQSPGQEDPLEKGMATHSSIFPWRILCIEEPGELYFMGSQTTGHDWATHTHTHTHTHQRNLVLGELSFNPHLVLSFPKSFREWSDDHCNYFKLRWGVVLPTLGE